MKTDNKAKTKRTSAEKLAALIEQREKLITAKNGNNEKGKEIDSKLSTVNEKIHNYEMDRLYKVCRKRKIELSDVISFLENLPEAVSLAEAAEIILKGKTANIEPPKIEK